MKAHPFKDLRPMKAPSKSCNPRLLTYPRWGSAKLDGLRCLGVGDGLVSSSLDPFRNAFINSLMKSPKLHGLDGELIVGAPYGTDVLNRTQSGITSASGEPDFTWWLFDDFSASGGWLERFTMLKGRVAALPKPLRDRIKILSHHTVSSVEAMEALEQKWIGTGYEGSMLRTADGPYKFGRCTFNEGWILKLKQFEDSEALVLSVEEGQVNLNEARGANGRRSASKAGKLASGLVGAIIGRDLRTGKLVRIAPGQMNLADRRRHWLDGGLPGQTITYKFFPPNRFPTFKCIRAKGT